jgi:hypothetical protein
MSLMEHQSCSLPETTRTISSKFILEEHIAHENAAAGYGKTRRKASHPLFLASLCTSAKLRGPGVALRAHGEACSQRAGLRELRRESAGPTFSCNKKSYNSRTKTPN